MCTVSRRQLLATGGACLSGAAEQELLGRARQGAATGAAPRTVEVAAGVFFLERDPFSTGSNRGWVVFAE